MTVNGANGVPLPLTAADLISNRALRSEDADDFGYSAIAGRVAETILALEPPLTVGLFGPWGSGKTSICELLRRELSAKDPDARLVYYDASTYGGEALKRNFISHVATELDYDAAKYPKFHQGLYESSRRTEVDFEALREKLWPTAIIIVALWFGFLLIFCALAGVTSLGTDKLFWTDRKDVAPADCANGDRWLGGCRGRSRLERRDADAEQSRPASDEAFSKCFRDLVDQGRHDGRFKRLVVFVDELDRCSSEDVVATLTAIRTFLTQKHAVFVVAADRAAIERALEEKLPQPTPVNEEDPYYSSASSFFDKVFHDRVPLPPLRGPRLYEWAYKKVVSRSGYWGQLNGVSDRELRSLLYFLIPSHVRAPRRVKVLLNSFVRSAAIAAHSDLDWLVRAREIAKLTVLDTEFPALGADLRVEPRLPELLLDPPASPSARVSRLLAKHGGYRLAQGPGEHEPPSDEDQEAEVPADEILAEATDAERRALVRSEHEHLRRYLARTRDVRINRDLLFLERAGAALGLEDPELESLLDQAVDVPSDVVSALNDSDTETRRLAARFLADMAEREFGEERANVIAALMGVVELLDAEVEPIVGEVAGSVQSYARDEGLADAHLLGALILAISHGASPVFQRSVLSNDRLFADPQRFSRVCRMLERVPPEARDLVYLALAERVAGDSDGFISALGEISPGQAGEALRSKPVYHALFESLRPQGEEQQESGELAERVYALAAERGADGESIRRAMHYLLLREEIGYAPLQAHAAEVLADIEDDEERDEQILMALYIYDHRDVEFWTGQLSQGNYASPSQGAFAVRIIVNCLSNLHELPIDEADVRLAVVDAISRFAAMAEPSERSHAIDAAVGEIEAVPWWSDEPSRLRDARLHRLAVQWASDNELGANLRPRLAADLVRSVVDPAAVNEETWQGMVEMGSELGSMPRLCSTHLSSSARSAGTGRSGSRESEPGLRLRHGWLVARSDQT